MPIWVQMHELLEREDPYSYYRGQSQSFANITPRERVVKLLWYGGPLASIAALAYKWYLEEQEKDNTAHVKGQPMERQTLTNWSGTQQVITKKLWQPESLGELEELVATSHMLKQKIRVTGAGLSPNGISFERGGMVSLALMDKICENTFITIPAPLFAMLSSHVRLPAQNTPDHSGWEGG